MPVDFEAFVLIGGASKRFGADKAFVTIDGETLAERAARKLQEAFTHLRVRFIAASEQQFGIKAVELNAPVVVDRSPGSGAWSGLDAALYYSCREWTLVLACDLPFVTTELLKELSSRANETVDAVVPRQRDGRLQPLCALYKTETVRDVVGRVIAHGDRLPPLATLFENLEHAIIEVGPEVLRNINTPGDLR